MIFAQLTDLHACEPGTLAYGRVDTLPFAMRAVARLNALRPRIEAVVISGDLAERGAPAEYEALRPVLDRLEMPWWPIPGNHDGAAFAHAFTDRMPGAVPGVGYEVRRGEHRFVLLDTSVPGEAHGLLDDARLEWLTQQFDGADRSPSLLVLHHPPFDVGIAHMDRIGLRGRERLGAAFAPAPPLAILCGHVHRTIHGTLSGVPAIVAPSPAHAVAFDLSPDGPSEFRMEPPGVLVHATRPGGLVTHTVFVDEHEGPYPFFP